ncbi:unnamed protein product [Bursaphelenchus xylophilus]|uniref:(pine wood nematode) hypothetical protein n=1 Tax=Bursaphelenchus xylophilus TaxID=6326 RepID=A0A1I7SVW6_BURXY|nr:unnamed protein product [Bursaphelenchus xylophilus]CAG9098403.1 unnamed protein product [Bursaphelenchus xylophilus]
MIQGVFTYLEKYGWYTLIAAALVFVIYQKYLSDKLQEYQQNRELEKQKKDDDAQRDKHRKKLEEVRRKQQEEYDAEVAREKERQKALEEERKKEKLERLNKEDGDGNVLFDALNFVNEQVGSKKVVIFSKSWCPYSRKAKQVLLGVYRVDQKDYKVIELDEMETGDLIQDALQRVTGGRSVPRVFVNGQFIGGGDDTERLHKENKMAGLLKDAGVQFLEGN